MRGRLWLLAIAGLAGALAIGAGLWLLGVPRASNTPDLGASNPVTTRGAVVGADLHSLVVYRDRIYVGGHGGVGVSADGGQLWSAVPSLTDADAMGWALSKGRLLVGGHPGLRVSNDGGATFVGVDGPSGVTDVHALGGIGSTLYLASPTGGLFASSDGGRTWISRNPHAGQTLMGTMLVDPVNPSHVVAPDMQAGAVVSTDSGANWRSLGGPKGTMSVTWDPKHVDHLVVAGMDGAAQTTDGGRTWKPMQLPAGATLVALADSGRTFHAAAQFGETARVFTSRDSGRTWLTM